jgi:tetratricopeptide (TPR) repeat protein
MHFFLKGLAGSADLYQGNNDGVVSLREAASYANREVKAHMFLKHGQWQEPDLLLGESTMNFPLAVVQKAPAKGAPEDDLAFMQRYGDTLVRWSMYGRAREYDLAVDLLTQVVRSQPENRDAYARRAAAYRAKGEYSRALADFEKAGSSLELFVKVREATLAVPEKKTPPLPPGCRLSVSQIQNNWLWVTAVDNDPSERLQGWIDKSQVTWDPGLADLVLPTTPQRAQPDPEVMGRLLEIANGVNYMPRYVPTGVSIPGIPTPSIPGRSWIYVPDYRQFIPSRPGIPSIPWPSIPISTRPRDWIPVGVPF